MLSDLEPRRIWELPVKVAADGIDQQGIGGTCLSATSFFERQDALDPPRALLCHRALGALTPGDGKTEGPLSPIVGGFYAVLS